MKRIQYHKPVQASGEGSFDLNTVQTPSPAVDPQLNAENIRKSPLGLKHAPVYTPNPEEFKDPLAYIQKIRPEAEKAGICKIIPPKGWIPPFSLDVKHFRFHTRRQQLNSLEGKARTNQNYLDQLYRFHAQQGSPLIKIPHLDHRPIDLYDLRKEVAARGGFYKVTEEKRWAEIGRSMNYDRKNCTSMSNSLKVAYSKIILPFELYLKKLKARGVKGGGDLPLPSGDAKVASPVTPKRRSRRITSGSKEDGAKGDEGSASAKRRKTQPGTDVSDKNASSRGDTEAAGVPVKAHGNGNATPSSSSQTALENDSSKGDGAVPSPSAVTAVNQQQQQSIPEKCEICHSAEDEESMLICDGCDKGFHMYCLNPPLKAVPPNDWYCDNCIITAGTDFGFEDGETYTLNTFQKKCNDFKRKMFAKYYRQMGEGTPYKDVVVDPSEVEAEFWRLVGATYEDVEVEYGADLHSNQHGSGFPTPERDPLEPYAKDPWNLTVLPFQRQSLFRYINQDISGMMSPWLYVGMCFSTFCWHNEDHYTYSINYNHWGDIKTWYGVPGDAADKFEETMRREMPELFESQPDLLFQLVTMYPPQQLVKHGVPVYFCDQYPGEFIVTFPQAYHSGFNQGFNFAEAVNFAMSDWIQRDLECVKRYQQYSRAPVFSHDGLLMTVVSAEHSAKTSFWLRPVFEEMVQRELGERRRLRDRWKSRLKGLRFRGEVPEEQQQCLTCKAYAYLSSVVCTCDSKAAACLSHVNELCRCDISNKTLRLRYTDDELEDALTKVVESAGGYTSHSQAVAASHSEWEHAFSRVMNALGGRLSGKAAPKPALAMIRAFLTAGLNGIVGTYDVYTVEMLAHLKRFVQHVDRWTAACQALFELAGKHDKVVEMARFHARDVAKWQRLYPQLEEPLATPEPEYWLLSSVGKETLVGSGMDAEYASYYTGGSYAHQREADHVPASPLHSLVSDMTSGKPETSPSGISYTRRGRRSSKPKQLTEDDDDDDYSPVTNSGGRSRATAQQQEQQQQQRSQGQIRNVRQRRARGHHSGVTADSKPLSTSLSGDSADRHPESELDWSRYIFIESTDTQYLRGLVAEWVPGAPVKYEGDYQGSGSRPYYSLDQLQKLYSQGEALQICGSYELAALGEWIEASRELMVEINQHLEQLETGEYVALPESKQRATSARFVSRLLEVGVYLPEAAVLFNRITGSSWSDRVQLAFDRRSLTYMDLLNLLEEAIQLNIPDKHPKLQILKRAKLEAESWNSEARAVLNESRRVTLREMGTLLERGHNILCTPSSYEELGSLYRHVATLQDRVSDMVCRMTEPSFLRRPRLKDAQELIQACTVLPAVNFNDIEQVKKGIHTAEFWLARAKCIFVRSNASRSLHDILADVENNVFRCTRRTAKSCLDESLPNRPVTAVYCVCRNFESGLMIECDECREWYHARCLNIKRKSAKQGDRFVCPLCNFGFPVPHSTKRPQVDIVSALVEEGRRLPFVTDELEPLVTVVLEASRFRDTILHTLANLPASDAVSRLPSTPASQLGARELILRYYLLCILGMEVELDADLVSAVRAELTKEMGRRGKRPLMTPPPSIPSESQLPTPNSQASASFSQPPLEGSSTAHASCIDVPPNPRIASVTLPTSGAMLSPDREQCLCRQFGFDPNPSRPVIPCSYCNQWYHTECAQVGWKDAQAIVYYYNHPSERAAQQQQHHHPGRPGAPLAIPTDFMCPYCSIHNNMPYRYGEVEVIVAEK